MPWNPEGGSPPARTLLIQLRRIGDAVLVTPLLDALREHWPESRTHLLTTWPIPQLFVGDDRVDAVWCRPPARGIPSLALGLRREQFDLVLDLQSLPLTAVLSRATGGFTVGFRKRGRGRLYHRGVSLDPETGPEYAAEHKLELLRAVGVPAVLGSPRLTRGRIPPRPGSATSPMRSGWNDLPRPRVAVVPVSRRQNKRWAPEAFAQTMTRLHDRTGAGFLILGGPGEAISLKAVAHATRDLPVRTHCCEALDELAALLEGADLFLGNDNGPRHIAAALGVPTLAWFGPQNPAHWTPPDIDRHPVLWDRARGRSPRRDLVIVPDTPEDAARAAACLLEGS